MAKGNSKNEADIKKIAGGIFKSQFGTKMPSGEPDKISEDQLIYTQMIMGGVASLVWGIKNAKEPNKLISALGKTNNIYYLVESIKKENDVIGKQTSTITAKVIDIADNIKKLTENIETEIKGSISIALTGSGENINSINTLVNNLSNFSNDSELFKSLTALDKLIKFISDINIDSSKINENLQKIYETLNNEGDKTSLSKIFDQIGEIATNKNITSDVDALGSILSSIILAITIEKDKVNTEALGDLVDVTSSGGSIEKLLGNIKNITKEVIENTKNIEVLEDFINIISKLGDVGLIKTIKSKLTLSIINKLLIGELRQLITNIDTFKDLDKKYNKTFEALNNFFGSIIKLGEVDIKDRRKMYMNLMFIKSYVSNEIKYLINDIIDELHVDKEKFELIEKIHSLIESIVNVGNIDTSKLEDSYNKIDDIETFIQDDLVGLLNFIIKEINIDILKQVNNILKSTLKVFDNLNKINDNIPGIGSVIVASTKIMLLDIEYSSIDNLFKRINNLDIPSKETLTNLENTLKTFGEINKLTDNINGIVSVIKQISILSVLAISSKITNVGLEGMVEAAEHMKNVIGVFSDVDEETLKKAQNAVNLFSKLVIMSAGVLLVGALAMKFIKISDLILFTATLTFFLFATSGVYVIIGKYLRNSLDGAKDASLLITASAFVMIIGGLAMKYINVVDLILFTTVLAAFLYSIIGTYVITNNLISDALGSSKDAVLLIAVSAFILLLGSKLIKPADFLNAILFGVALAAFIFLILLAFIALKDNNLKELLGVGQDLAILVGISALSLMLGSLVVHFIKWYDIVLFTLCLGLLIMGTVGIFRLANKEMNKALKSARDLAILIGVSGLLLLFATTLNIDGMKLAIFLFNLLILIGGVIGIYIIAGKFYKKAVKGLKDVAILVVGSGLILILAGLISKYIDLGNLAIFTLILGAFILSILSVYRWASEGFKHAFRGAKEMLLLIGISSLILIIGSIVVKRYVDLLYLGLFTVLLGGFVFTITWVFGKYAEKIERAWGVAITMALLTGISAYMLIMGGRALSDNPDLVLLVPIFGLMLLGYVWLMSEVCQILQQNSSNILIGEGIMLTIMGITYISALVIDKLANIANNEGFLLNILKGVGAIALIVVAVGGIAIGLGALMSSGGTGIGAALFYLGVATMTVICGVALLAAEAMENIAIAMQELQKVKKFNPQIIIDNIQGFVGIAEELGSITGYLPTILKASLAITVMSYALSKTAKTVQEWADLKIPIYKGTEIVGYRTIESTAFSIAAKHIKEVVTTLAQAVIDVYNEQPGLFDVKFGDIFTGGSPFSKVCRSIQTMAPALSAIADTIKDWADLKIPVYTGTKITGYKTIVSSDFVTAAKNIQQVVVTLAQAVIDTYNNAPHEMFESDEWLGFGTSPFAKVTKALKTMGPMLSSIADGIKDWADLKIPIYDDNNGKIKGYQNITGDMLKIAAKNISDVIITIGSAIIGAYLLSKNDPKLAGIFESDEWFGFGDSPFAKVTRAFKTIGPMLSSIANGIKEWVDLKIPIYNDNGKIKGYQNIVDADLQTAADNIGKVLTCIGGALVSTVNSAKNKEIFNAGMLEDSPAQIAANAMKTMGEVLSMTALAVASYATGIFPMFDKDGKIVGTIDIIKDTGSSDLDGALTKAKDNIYNVLSCIGTALKDIVGDSEIFNEGMFTGSPAEIASSAIKNMADALLNTVEAISKLSELDLTKVAQDLSNDKKFPDNTYHKLRDILLNVKKMVSWLIWDKGLLAFEGDSFVEWLDENAGDIGKGNGALSSFTGLLTDLTNNLAELGKTYIVNQNRLYKFTKTKEQAYSPFADFFCQAMSSIVDIHNSLAGKDKLRMYDDFINNEEKITSGINSALSIINTLVGTKDGGGIKAIADIYKSLNDANFTLDNLTPLLNSFNSIIKSINNIGSADVKLGLPKIESDELYRKIDDYTQTLNMIINAALLSQTVNENDYNVLRDGINKIYSATSNIKNNESFSNHAETLKEYVKTINSISTIKVMSLTKFAEAINKLSSNLGNLDNLTDALANKLSIVLYELVNQLMKADASINNAHTLQKKREDLINKSIKQIESIMGQHMIVEVKQMTEEDMNKQGNDDNAPKNSGNINGKETTNNEAAGEGEKQASDNKKLDNFEKTTATVKQGSTKNEDGLTYDQFINYMETSLLKKLSKIKDIT